jgi:hypothetical protein
MKRVETLLQKLQEQFKEGATTGQLLLTTQMLQHELMHLQQQEPKAAKEVVAVSMPANMNFAAPAPAPVAEREAPEVKTDLKLVKEEEKTVEVLKVDEAELEAELEEIKRNAALMQQMGGKSKPQLLFDLADEEIPTLLPKQKPTGTKEINEAVATAEAPSVNDILKNPVTELSHKLTEVGIKDLRKAIGINDRYLFINDLFRGDEAMYERSIKTINSFTILPEAEYWIRRELKTKLGWTDSNATVVHFDQLVKRRFS